MDGLVLVMLDSKENALNVYHKLMILYCVIS